MVFAAPTAVRAQSDSESALQVSPEHPSSISYVSDAAERAEALRLKRRNFVIAGSILLPVGVACGVLSPFVANAQDDLRAAFGRGFAIGFVGLAAGVSGIALLGRSRGLKKERERLLQPTVGIGYVGVQGSF